jgi:hypothetical protein
MNDTPRTDEAAFVAQTGIRKHDVVTIAFSETLERELNAALAANAELLERLQEARESHLIATARKVQTIQQQSVMLERLAAALKSIAWIKETGNRDYSWTGDTAFEAFSAYNQNVQTIQQQAVEIDRLKSVLADIYSLSRS